MCFFSALWEYQSRHGGALPDDSEKADELEAIAAELLSKSGVNRQALPHMPKELAS